VSGVAGVAVIDLMPQLVFRSANCGIQSGTTPACTATMAFMAALLAGACVVISGVVRKSAAGQRINQQRSGGSV
jgi:hypothetical protein